MPSFARTLRFLFLIISSAGSYAVQAQAPVKQDTLISHLGPHDMLQVWDEKGRIVLEGFLKDGKKHGTWTEYHATGFPATVTSYLNGEFNG